MFLHRWQLAITLPGWPPKPPPLPVIMEVENHHRHCHCHRCPHRQHHQVEEEPVPEKPPETPVPAGDIKTKMTGAIASMATVKKAKPLEKPAPKPDAPKLGGAMPSGGGTADWRSEVKKRDRAKQQEKLNAMPQGMPDYRFAKREKPIPWKIHIFTGSLRRGLFLIGGQNLKRRRKTMIPRICGRSLTLQGQ